MAVNELERDWLKILHMVDIMDNIQRGLKMEHEDENARKKNLGNIVMSLESEMLDSKYMDAGKDVGVVQIAIDRARAYWKS